MSYISEKVAYLDGLADGIGIEDDKQGKLLRGIIDEMETIIPAENWPFPTYYDLLFSVH